MERPLADRRGADPKCAVKGDLLRKREQASCPRLPAKNGRTSLLLACCCQEGSGIRTSPECSISRFMQCFILFRMKASIKLRLRTPFRLAAPEMPRANVSGLQGLHQGPVTTWSVTLFALYFTTKCSLELMLAPCTVAKRPLTELAVRIPNTLPTVGTKPLSRPMFSVPLKLAVPVTASRSNWFPGVVPAILMSRAPAGFCV